MSATPAAATESYANHAWSLVVPGRLVVPDGADARTAGGGLGLEWRARLDGPFELAVRVEGLGWHQRLDLGAVLSVGGQLGVRYVLGEAALRPFFQASLVGLGFVAGPRVGASGYGGPGLGAGAELFVADSVSVGALASVELWLTLGAPAHFTASLALAVSAFY